jgi:hypothetical protein
VLAHDGLVCGLTFPALPCSLSNGWAAIPSPKKPSRASRIRRVDSANGLVKTWEQAGREPLAIGGASGPGAAPEETVLMDQLQRLRLTNCLAHGVSGVDGKPISFFEFFNLPVPPGVREKRMLQLFDGRYPHGANRPPAESQEPCPGGSQGCGAQSDAGARSSMPIPQG